LSLEPAIPLYEELFLYQTFDSATVSLPHLPNIYIQRWRELEIRLVEPVGRIIPRPRTLYRYKEVRGRREEGRSYAFVYAYTPPWRTVLKHSVI
jgi:hypothetical protein